MSSAVEATFHGAGSHVHPRRRHERNPNPQTAIRRRVISFRVTCAISSRRSLFAIGTYRAVPEFAPGDHSSSDFPPTFSIKPPEDFIAGIRIMPVFARGIGRLQASGRRKWGVGRDAGTWSSRCWTWIVFPAGRGTAGSRSLMRSRQAKLPFGRELVEYGRIDQLTDRTDLEQACPARSASALGDRRSRS